MCAGARFATSAAVADIVAVSERNNFKAGITGKLQFSRIKPEFAKQTLEGDKEQVLKLLEVIRADPRHSNLKVTQEGKIDRRQFEKWSMQFEIAAPNSK